MIGIVHRHMLCAVLVVGMWTAGPARAQTTAPAKPIVTFDPDGGFFASELPHGQAFIIEISGDNEVSDVQLWAASDCGKPAKNPRSIKTIGSVDRDGKHFIHIDIEKPLQFNTEYCFSMKARRGLSVAEKTRLQNVLTEILDGQILDPSRNTAARNQLITIKLGALGGRKTVSGKLVREVVMSAIQPDDKSESKFQQAFDSAVKRGHDEERVALLWKELHGTGADPRTEFQKVLGPPLPPDIDTAAGKLAAFRGGATPSTVLIGGTPPALLPAGKALHDQAEALVNATEATALTHCSAAALAAQLNASTKRLEAADTTADRKQAQNELAKAKQDAAALATPPMREVCAVLERSNGEAKSLLAFLDQAVHDAADLTAAHAAAVAALPDLVTAIDTTEVITAAVSQPTYTERSALYISADFGVLLPIFVDSHLNSGGTSLATYLGFNVYLGAVDKNVPLSVEDGFVKRFSFVLGLTLDSISDDASSVEGVFGSKALVSGVGVRLSDYIRFGGGAVWFRQARANPTVTDKPIRAAPYLSISVDIDVAGTLAAIIKKGTP